MVEVEVHHHRATPDRNLRKLKNASLVHENTLPQSGVSQRQNTDWLYRSATNLILNESLSEKREAVCSPHDSCFGLPEALVRSRGFNIE